jgi:hypothetical protein
MIGRFLKHDWTGTITGLQAAQVPDKQEDPWGNKFPLVRLERSGTKGQLAQFELYVFSDLNFGSKNGRISLGRGERSVLFVVSCSWG